jgi:hypothetical protein
MARQQGGFPAPSQPDDMGQARIREEGACSRQSQGEGAQRGEGDRATSAFLCHLVWS